MAKLIHETSLFKDTTIPLTFSSNPYDLHNLLVQVSSETIQIIDWQQQIHDINDQNDQTYSVTLPAKISQNLVTACRFDGNKIVTARDYELKLKYAHNEEITLEKDLLIDTCQMNESKLVALTLGGDIEIYDFGPTDDQN